MIWIQRVVSLLAIVTVSYVIWWLAKTDSGDATLVGVLALVFNVVVYFLGRSDRYSEDNKTPYK